MTEAKEHLRVNGVFTFTGEGVKLRKVPWNTLFGPFWKKEGFGGFRRASAAGLFRG
jgi:hypothetical protein